MTEAFILITQQPGTTPVLDLIKKIPEVVQIYPVYGVYDLIAKVQTDTMSELNDIVNYNIRRIEGITSTLTMIVIQ